MWEAVPSGDSPPVRWKEKANSIRGQPAVFRDARGWGRYGSLVGTAPAFLAGPLSTDSMATWACLMPSAAWLE